MVILMLHRFVRRGEATRLLMCRRVRFIVGPLGVLILGLGLAARRPRLVVRWSRYWMRRSGERVFP